MAKCVLDLLAEMLTDEPDPQKYLKSLDILLNESGATVLRQFVSAGIEDEASSS